MHSAYIGILADRGPQHHRRVRQDGPLTSRRTQLARRAQHARTHQEKPITSARTTACVPANSCHIEHFATQMRLEIPTLRRGNQRNIQIIDTLSLAPKSPSNAGAHPGTFPHRPPAPEPVCIPAKSQATPIGAASDSVMLGYLIYSNTQYCSSWHMAMMRFCEVCKVQSCGRTLRAAGHEHRRGAEGLPDAERLDVTRYVSLASPLQHG